jgi:hypothetical protein
MSEMSLTRNMILDLADAYEVSNESFNIYDQNIIIHLVDVSNIWDS